MVDLAQHYNEGPIQTGEIANRQDISVKYLEQLIIPLKKANFVKSVRGPKGGHMLAKPPEEITIGEIVKILEGGIELTVCIENDGVCKRAPLCPTRGIWKEATKAMSDKLDSIPLSNIINKEKGENF